MRADTSFGARPRSGWDGYQRDELVEAPDYLQSMAEVQPRRPVAAALMEALSCINRSKLEQLHSMQRSILKESSDLREQAFKLLEGAECPYEDIQRLLRCAAEKDERYRKIDEQIAQLIGLQNC